jgi:hypothetical protein
MTINWFTKIFVDGERCFLSDFIDEEISLHTEIKSDGKLRDNSLLQGNREHTFKDNTVRRI